jgi:D-serine deaminase-like pyridoxal phosphate-dependent protein
MTTADIPTPALLVDLDTLDANIAAMAMHAAKAGKRLRPHAKAHKCVQIARRQIAAGAIGVCVATVPEAELMVRARIGGVLLTSPIADPHKCERMASLCTLDAGLMAAVDHPEQVRMYAEASEAAGVTLALVVDLDVGDHRTGIAPGKPALEVAQQIAGTNGVSFAGLQAYSVRASHLREDEGRAEFSIASLHLASETKELLESHGIPVGIVTGASTGTYECDAVLPYMTELQSGSYALMDYAYARIGGIDFGHAMSVLATVVSANHEDRVTIDAGFKAFSTDRPFGPRVCGIDNARYEWAGDEFGFVLLDSTARNIRLGDRLRFIPPHCDPTVNLYDRLYVCRGETVEEVWPVMDRTRACSARTE